jgi:hypothetical protein
VSCCVNPLMRFIWIFLLAFLTACAGPKGTAQKHKVTDDHDTWDAPFTLLDASVHGDSLKVSVQFGGGFRDHEFRIESAGVATKSWPRQQPLNLFHNGHGDMGRALLREERSFDLTPFQDPSQSKILLRLADWPDLLDYNYQR